MVKDGHAHFPGGFMFFSHDNKLVINATRYPRTYRALGALWRMTGGYCLHARVGINTVDFIQFTR